VRGGEARTDKVLLLSHTKIDWIYTDKKLSFCFDGIKIL